MHDRIDHLERARSRPRPGWGVTALLLVAACGAGGKPPAGGPAASPPPAAIAPVLRWSPELDDAVGPDGATLTAVTLELCTAADRCGAVARYEPPRQLLAARLSVTGTYAFVWHRAPPAIHLLDIHDVARAQRVAQLDLGEPAEARRDTTELRWTAGDSILHTWGAGTFVALGRLYSATGAVLLEVDAPAIEVSPDLRYLVTYPPPETPLAEPRRIALYDLRDGTLVAERAGDVGAVTRIAWREGKAVISYQTSAQRPGELVLP